MVEEGRKAPEFKLESDDGATVALGKLKGSPVVLYFYPKDDTSGCTTEAKAFTALADELAKVCAVVVGISPDSVESHKKFKKKHELDVVLAADTDKAVAEA
jgi:peroxiredoxin Q/BCP